MKPNFAEEKKLWKRGFEVVVGLDEVGRGPLAGPVVACAVMVKNPNFQIPMSNEIPNPKPQKIGHWSLEFGAYDVRDSKQLSEKKREELYEILTKHPSITWGIGVVSETIIDKINILQATKLAMKKALDNLEKRQKETYTLNLKASKFRVYFKGVDFLLIDGNFILDGLQISQKSIIKGDSKVFSIAAASIIAKVTRDRMMQEMHIAYPEYGFDQHKGYGTPLHLKKIKEHGPCKIHRKSFYPVSSFLN